MKMNISIFIPTNVLVSYQRKMELPKKNFVDVKRLFLKS